MAHRAAVQGRPPDPAAALQRRPPALRAQPGHRRGAGHGPAHAGGAGHGAARRGAPHRHHAAGHRCHPAGPSPVAADMRKYKKGSNVRWSWGHGTGYGQVTDSFTRRVQRTIKGSKIVKNGSRALPGLPDRAGRRRPRAQAALGDRAQLTTSGWCATWSTSSPAGPCPGWRRSPAARTAAASRSSTATAWSRSGADGATEFTLDDERDRPAAEQRAPRPVRPGHRHGADRRGAGRRPADRPAGARRARAAGCPAWSTGTSWRCAPSWASRSRWPAPPRWPGGWWPSTAGRSRGPSAP